MKLNRYIIYILIFTATFTLFTPFAIRGIDPHHDGLMLKTALDVLNGQVLFKETFTQYGSLTIYIQTLLMFLFGQKLIVLKLGTVAFYSATAVIQFAIGRKYMPFILSIFTYIFWLILAPFYREGWALLSWSSSFALFFQSLSILFFMKTFESNSSKWQLFFCGFFAAAGFWCRIPVGITLLCSYFIIFICCFIIKNKWPNFAEEKTHKFINNFAYFVIGSTLVFVTFFAVLIFTGSTSEWHYQVFDAPKRWLNNSFGISINRILWSLFYNPTSGLFLALAIALTFTSVFFIKNKFNYLPKWSLWILTTMLIVISIVALTSYDSTSLDIFGGWASAIPTVLLAYFLFIGYKILFAKKPIEENQFILLCLTIISIASWHQYFPVTCYRHIFWGVTPALGPFLMICYYLSNKKTNIVLFVISTFLIQMTSERVKIAIKNLNLDYVMINSPSVLSGMYSSKKMAYSIHLIDQTMKKYLDEHPKTPVLLDGGDALYNTFVENLKNPEAIFVNWGYSDEDSLSKRIDFIKNQRPIIIVEGRSKEIVRSYESRFGYKSQLNVDSIEILFPLKSK